VRLGYRFAKRRLGVVCVMEGSRARLNKSGEITRDWSRRRKFLQKVGRARSQRGYREKRSKEVGDWKRRHRVTQGGGASGERFGLEVFWVKKRTANCFRRGMQGCNIGVVENTSLAKEYSKLRRRKNIALSHTL